MPALPDLGCNWLKAFKLMQFIQFTLCDLCGSFVQIPHQETTHMSAFQVAFTSALRQQFVRLMRLI